MTPPAAHLDAAFVDLKAGSIPRDRREMLVDYVEEAMKEMLERGQRSAEICAPWPSRTVISSRSWTNTPP